MTDYEYLSTSISFDSNGVVFKSNGKITLFDGFMKVLNTKENENILPDLKMGDIIKAVEIKKDQHFTKPPANYTEASLVKTLEEYGIGRPSTYSSTIASILSLIHISEPTRHTNASRMPSSA